MKRFLFILLITIAQTSLTFSQTEPTGELGEGSFNKEKEKMTKVWGPRMNGSNNFAPVAQNIEEYLEAYNNQTSSGNFRIASPSFDPNWRCLGPEGTPNPIPSAKFHKSEGTGQIHALAFDPRFDNILNTVIYAGTPYGGLWRSDNNGQNWYNLNTDDLPIASVSDIAINPDNHNEIFISTGLGDYGYPTWEPNRAKTNPIWTIGIYRSLDYGNTWSPINKGLLSDFQNGGAIRRLIINPNNPSEIFCATSNGIYKTIDGLSNSPQWQRIFYPTNDDQFKGLEFKPNNSSILYASGKDIYQSYDNGTTWQSITGASKGLDINNLPYEFKIHRINIATTNANSEKLFAYLVGEETHTKVENGETKITKPVVVYIYMYDGTTWQQLHYDNKTGDRWTKTLTRTAIAVSPNDENKILFGTTHLIGTSNGTDFFKKSEYSGFGFHADVHAIEFPPVDNNSFVFVGHDGGISKKDLSISSTKSGWSFLNDGLQVSTIWDFDDHDFDPDIAYITNQDCGTNRMNSSNSWEMISGGDGYGVQIPDFSTENIYFRDTESLYRHNSTTNINDQEEPYYPNDPIHGWRYPDIPNTFKIRTHPQTREEIWGFYDLFIRKREVPLSSDLNTGQLWDPISNLGIDGSEWYERQIMEFEISESNPDYQYISTLNEPQGFDCRLYRTKLEGCSGPDLCFEDITQNIPPGYIDPSDNSATKPIITGIAIHPQDPKKIWISLTGADMRFRVLYSVNAGDTWEDADPNRRIILPANNIVYQDGSNDRLFLATDAGVYTKDADSDWEEYGNFPNVRVTQLKINKCANVLRAATYGRSLWEGDLPPANGPSNYYMVNNSATWADGFKLLKNLKVQNNSTLNIQSQVLIPPKGRIQVEEGSTINISETGFIQSCRECSEITFVVNGNLNINNIETAALFRYSFEVGATGNVNITSGNLCQEQLLDLNIAEGGVFNINGKVINSMPPSYLFNNTSVSGHYSASQTITTENSVNTTGTVSFTSGHNIHLQAGFHAVANFSASVSSWTEKCGFTCQSPSSMRVASERNHETHYVGNNDHLTNSSSSSTAPETDNLELIEYYTQTYPNPFNNEFKVSFYDNFEANVQRIEIKDIYGRTLQSSSTIDPINYFSLPGNSGVYLVVIQTDIGVLTKKVIQKN